MNKVFQRKLLYGLGALLLYIPISWLGLPAEPAREGGTGGSPGGKLAQLRKQYELGEDNLGNVDPASSTMNLLLLGFRGVATSMLWMDAQQQQKNKDWASLRSTVDSIILLQPHFLKVWHFQGWNLAYNVSAEWDLVPDRYYWVKEGIKFYQLGKERNQKSPELYWYIGDTSGKKIGRSDEWRQFRRFWNDDPDKINYPNGIDPRINPEGKDNYLVAKEWFEQSLQVEDTYHIRQHIMADYLFRGYPARAQLDYASALQREGKFGEVTRIAWEDAFRDITTGWGRADFDNPTGEPVQLEWSYTDDWPQMQQADAHLPETKRKSYWVLRHQDTSNYRFWRTRAAAESTSVMSEARQLLYDGEQAYLAADFTKAREKLYDGMTKLEETLEEFPDLTNDDLTVEDAMIAQLYWRAALENDGEPPPVESEGYPLQELWISNQPRMASVLEEFNRRKRAPPGLAK
ncbi:MAG: hypothetical protein ACT4QC_05545 [Planctomycetaceae bacterium]